MNKLQKVRIKTHQRFTDDVYLIRFSRSFNFIPGQIIGLTNNLEIPPRLYSICSSNRGANVGILYQVKKDGLLTPGLEKNKVGDELWISEVQGKFIYDNEPAWWIATGTGIAPFYSMLKSGLKPLKLIQGARKMNQFYFRDELSEIEDYVLCCSQEKGADLYQGRLTAYINSFENLPTNINYYLCGSAEMVVDVRNLLISKGVSFNNILTEIYF